MQKKKKKRFCNTKLNWCSVWGSRRSIGKASSLSAEDRGIDHCSTRSSHHPHLSLSLADHWGTTGDFTTNFLHSSQFSAFRSMMFHSRPVHSLMLSSHRFLCLPLRLPPCTVPCRTVLASPDDRVTCLYYFSLCLFTEVRRSSYGPMAFSILVFTSSLVM